MPGSGPRRRHRGHIRPSPRRPDRRLPDRCGHHDGLDAHRPDQRGLLGRSSASGPRPGEIFAIYSRNTDGTVGNALFNDFTLSFDAFNFVTTATANSPFTLQAGASYWLTIYALPGQVVFWDSTITTGANYNSAFGVTLPTTNAIASSPRKPATSTTTSTNPSATCAFE